MKKNFKLCLTHLLFALVLIACNEITSDTENESENLISETKNKQEITQKYRISPPIKRLDLPYSSHKIETDKATNISFESGSKMKIPQHAFVNSEGEIYKGKVNVKYREFSDVVDIMMAGIPMEYDSAGQSYVFQSAVMCEVLAFDNENNALKLAQGKSIQMTIPSQYASTDFNLYYFDTLAGRWNYAGKDSVVIIDPNEKKSIEDMPPVKPRKPDESKEHLVIEIEDKDRYKEFAGLFSIQILPMVCVGFTINSVFYLLFCF